MEKSYKEALERAREIYNAPAATIVVRTWLEQIFPELKESEDERVRKEILEYFNQYKDEGLRGANITPWIAYLEKQKEQKTAELSDEEKKHLYNAIEAVKYVYDVSEGTSGFKCVEFLKSLCPQPHWKPSEEQMDRLFSIVVALRKDYCDDMADFLASLYKQLEKL